jgi:hypothetical protein
MHAKLFFCRRFKPPSASPLHIVVPAFTIGLATLVLPALHLKTGRPACRILFDWSKLFGVAFGLG